MDSLDPAPPPPANAPTPPRRRLRRRLLDALGLLALATGALALLEGTGSFLLLAYNVFTVAPPKESQHTAYDPELGWVNLPNVHRPDLYGPGIGLRTNSQRFRSDEDFPPQVASGRLRLVCSGDSFTLGYGVSDEEAWCRLLSGLDPRLETVNMGQGGYGVDQAYLWYRRESAWLEHNVHLFAFISEDFQRMGSDRFGGYGKPLLRLHEGELVVANRPVPLTAQRPLRLNLILSEVRGLRTYRLLYALLRGRGGAAAVDRQRSQSVEESQAVAGAIFADLARINRSRGRLLVLVLLPTMHDSLGPPDWRQVVLREGKRLGLHVIDLTSDFHHLPRADFEAMFLAHPGTPRFSHYSAKGNAFAAARLYERLMALPEFRQRVESLPAPSAMAVKLPG